MEEENTGISPTSGLRNNRNPRRTDRQGRVRAPTGHEKGTSSKKALSISVREMPTTTAEPPNSLAVNDVKPTMLALRVCWKWLPKVIVSCRECYCLSLQALKQFGE